MEASSTTDKASESRFPGLRTVTSAVIVILALAALLYSTHLVLDNFETTTVCSKACAAERKEGLDGVTTDNGSSNASSIVAVLSPVIAGIVGIAGLFFGLSASVTSKAQQAQADEQIAKSHAESQVAASESVQVAHETLQAALSVIPLTDSGSSSGRPGGAPSGSAAGGS